MQDSNSKRDAPAALTPKRCVSGTSLGGKRKSFFMTGIEPWSTALSWSTDNIHTVPLLTVDFAVDPGSCLIWEKADRPLL